MGLGERILGIITTGLILIFALIHLGVSIGIIAQNVSHNDMFRPEIGLAAFNIVISFLGILVGTTGLVCVTTHKEVLSKS